MPTPLPLLDTLIIATPCPAAWDEMQGDDRVRYCSLCQQSVFDVSAMTRADAEALVKQTTGRLCLRLFRRSDGRVMTRDCPVGVFRAARRRFARAVAAVTFLALFLFGWIASRPGASRMAREQVRMVENWISPQPSCIAGGIGLPPGPYPAVEDEDDE
jgi:hypothetical protein